MYTGWYIEDIQLQTPRTFQSHSSVFVVKFQQSIYTFVLFVSENLMLCGTVEMHGSICTLYLTELIDFLVTGTLL
jgi:hypothetical protein